MSDLWKTDVPKDVMDEISQRFKLEEQPTVIELLQDIGGPRLMRCAIHYSNGDIEKLNQAFDIAKRDYRDLIFWTEYDGMEKRSYDFNRIFNEAKLKY